MLANGVQGLLHLELLALDAQVVAFVERIEHLVGAHRDLGHTLVDFTHIFVEDDANVLELREKYLEDALLLLKLEACEVGLHFVGGGVRSENCTALRHKLVEGVARLHEDPLALESEVVHVLGEQNFAEAAREWRLLLPQEWSRLSLQG
jgi:hypothetical protein